MERIIRSHSWVKACHVQKKLLPSFQTQTSAERIIPMLFAEVEEQVDLSSLSMLQKKQLQQYFPPAMPSRKEYHTLKCYPFNSTLVNHVLQNTDLTVDFPFCVTEREHAIMTLRSNVPLLLLGRSGSGKTTCCLYRLFSKFREYWTMAKEADDPLQPHSLEYACHKGMEETDLNDEETESVPRVTKEGNYHIHQIFVTKNAVLCSEAQKHFHELSRACYMLHKHVEREAKNLPSRFQDVDECLYPLFITSRQLMLMLDASIGAPYFFERKEDGSLKVDIQGWSDSDGPLSRLELLNEKYDVEKDDSMDNEDQEQLAAGNLLEYKLRGEPIPQILITNKPSDRFSEEGISYLAANFFHRHNNRERMLNALNRLRCWQDQVEFLKQNKYLEEAVQILEENGQREEAVKLMLIHGRIDEAEQTARKTLHENIIAQTLLVKLQVIMSHEPKTISCTYDLQRTVVEAKALFQNCRNLDGFAEASLFHADFTEGVTDLTESVAHIKQAWNAFLESKPYGNLAGTLECVEWIVTHKQITKDNFMCLVRGFDHLFKVLQILCCSKSSQNQELLQKYDSFYGLFSTKPDYVIFYPKQNPRCKNILKNYPPSKKERGKQVEIETLMKAAHELIGSYLLNRAKGWLKDAVEAVTNMRNKVKQCLFYQVGLPCPDMEMQNGICPNLHCPLSNRMIEELIEFDKMFIELQRNIEFGAKHMRSTCPASLTENVEYFLGYTLISSQEEVDKFTSCRMILEDLIPMSFHSHMLPSGYPYEVLIKMKLPVKQYMKVFMEKKWKEDTTGERRFKTFAAKSANIFLMVEFCSHLFHIDFDFDKKLREFESALSEEQNQENKERKWRYLALMTDHESQNKSGSRWIVESLARRFYDSYYHLTKPTSDPLEALIKFTKFVAMISRKAKHVQPDTKLFLMWLEFYTTLAFFLIAKTNKVMQRNYLEQSDASFVVQANYLHLMNFIEATFPKHAKFIQEALSDFIPKRTSHALVQQRLDHIVIMVCGTSKSTGLLNILFSADLDQVFNCAMAERVIVLAMTLISNVGTFVSVKSETVLMQAIIHLQLPEKCSKRLMLALESVQKAQCIRDVGVALKTFLRERDEEHLMCCKWMPTRLHKDHRDHVQSSPLTNTGILPANFLGENTFAVISHEAVLGSEVMGLSGVHDDEIQMSVEEKMKWEIDTAALEKARTEKEAGIKILRFFRWLAFAYKCRHLTARVKEQIGKEEQEEKMKIFEAAKVTNLMCGI